jgi:hypothetical protein
LKTLTILLDVSGLSRSAIVAKQLAHNSLQGHDDKDMLRRLSRYLTEVDHILEAYLPSDIKVDPDATALDKMVAPHVNFDWKTVTFTFLPHQFTEFKALADSLFGSHDLLGLAALEQFKPLSEALGKYTRFKHILSVGMIVSVLTRMVELELAKGIPIEELMHEDGTAAHAGWVDLEFLLGSAQVSPEAAVIIKLALDKMQMDGAVTKKNLWQALEYWAADHLASGKSAVAG